MIVIAHRGANHEAIENSWAAFEAAISAKAQRIELDIQLTKDGKAIVMHDTTLKRTANAWEKVSSLTIDEIRKIRLKNGEEIPELEAVIEKLLPNIELNIEIKENGVEIAKVAANIIENSNSKNRVIVSSFHGNTLGYLRDNYPDIERACLWGCPPTSLKDLSNLAPQLMLERYETKIFHPRAALVSENIMEQSQLRGWTVYPWDSLHGAEDKNAEGIWTALKTYQVDGFCTNYPRQFRSWLEETKLDESKFKN